MIRIRIRITPTGLSIYQWKVLMERLMEVSYLTQVHPWERGIELAYNAEQLTPLFTDLLDELYQTSYVASYEVGTVKSFYSEA